MNVTVTGCGTYTRIIVDGRIDTTSSPQFQQVILSTFQKDKYIVIDFLNVQYISSAGLRALLIGQKTATSKGGTMKLTNVGDTVKDILEMSGFDSILMIE